MLTNGSEQIFNTNQGFVLVDAEDNRKPVKSKDIEKVINRIEKNGSNADGVAELSKKLSTVSMSILRDNI
jgi:hypothetical protein